MTPTEQAVVLPAGPPVSDEPEDVAAGREARARGAANRCMSEMHDVSERVEDIFVRAMLAFCEEELAAAGVYLGGSLTIGAN